MKVKIEFILTYKDESVQWSVRRELSRILYQLKKYRTGKTRYMSITYILDQDTELYQKVVDFYKKNKENIDFERWTYSVQILDEERESAVAFVPVFPDYYCEEYEDISNEYKECNVCWTNEKTEDIFYVQPKGYIKKHQDDYGMVSTDCSAEVVLLPKLVEKLIEEGVDLKYFQPVLSKRKKILGYSYMTENILPEGSFYNPNYKKVSQCPVCGHIKMKENDEECYFLPKMIKSKEVTCLQDVNFTYEFFDKYREVIVSKKVEKIIREYVKYAEFIPVFEA